jgi:hypothetical protein
MIDDPVVDEVHRIREQMLARWGGDLRALLIDAQRRTEEAIRAGRPVVSLPPRTPQPQPARTKKVG